MALRIAVVGSGAIGMYYGGKLAHAGSDVHFLMRGDLSEVRRNGIFVRGDGENFRVTKVNCYNSTKEIGHCNLVIIAVKATSNPDLVDLMPPLLHGKTALLTLQNGLGNEEFLAEHFGAERVLGGLCFIAADRRSKNEVERSAYGHVILGEFRGVAQPRTHEIAAEFSRAGVRCTVTDDLAHERWRKLIWNVPFNGLSIVSGGLDTGAIVGDENLRQLARELMDEIIAAANKLGHDFPSDAWQEHMRRAEKMGGFKPSTLVDFENNKPLEIEAIWGEPLRRAIAAGARMPRTEMIYSLLNGLNSKRRAKK
jgi:2-dehydropantoate 2-reductase